MESIGFKEWAAVCEALGAGRQSIILRKGGIAEGREGFSFRYNEFYLFPTWFHEQPDKVREFGGALLPGEDGVTIRCAAKLEQTAVITSLALAETLDSMHILKPEVVRERFQYDEAPGLHVAFVRVYRLAPAWTFPNEKKYGGCRSWVPLSPAPKNLQLEPVLNDAEHEGKMKQFLALVARPLEA